MLHAMTAKPFENDEKNYLSPYRNDVSNLIGANVATDVTCQHTCKNNLCTATVKTLSV